MSEDRSDDDNASDCNYDNVDIHLDVETHGYCHGDVDEGSQVGQRAREPHHN